MENKTTKNELKAYREELKLYYRNDNLSHAKFVKLYQEKKDKVKIKTFPKRRLPR